MPFEYKPGYSIGETGDALGGMAKSTVYEHIKAGRLKATKVGGRTIVLGSSLRDLLEGQAA